METVYIETQPTAEKNVASLKAILGNFDFMGPLRGPCLWVEMINPNGLPFDGQYVRIDGDDWQNWPCDQTDEQDYKYLSDVILRKVGLDWRHYLKFTQPPQFNLYTGVADYVFSCAVESYPTGSFSYQWNKDGIEIIGATSDTYTVSNAVESQTGVYSVVVSNNEFTITGDGYLYTSGSVYI